MKKTIGWIGTGKMGEPMASNLLKAGYTVHIYARNQQAIDYLLQKGAHSSASPKELLAIADILFLMVPDDKAVDDIFLNRNLFDGEPDGKTIVNMSTVSPAISRKMAALCLDVNATYLDIPVSGSVNQAEEGKLVLLAGGDYAAYERLQPILSVIGSKSIYVGDHGAGNTLKLAINMLLAIQAQALGEVINFATEKGIAAETVLEAINSGVMSSAFFRIKGQQIVQQNYTAAFALSQLVKDIDLAKKQGWDAPLGNTAAQTYTAALDRLGEEDIISIHKHLAGG